jgi:hypothetical protein
MNVETLHCNVSTTVVGNAYLTNFGGLSPQQDRQRVLCRGLSYKVAPLLPRGDAKSDGETPWRQPLYEGRRPQCSAKSPEVMRVGNRPHKLLFSTRRSANVTKRNYVSVAVASPRASLRITNYELF